MPNTQPDIVFPEIDWQPSIDNLIEFLDERDNWQTPHRYNILEWISPNQEPSIYELYNLTMECDNGIIISSDINEELWDNHHAIHSILVKDIDYIQFNSNENYITITLFGDSYDGYIRIYY